MDKLILYTGESVLVDKTNTLTVGVELDHQDELNNNTLIPVIDLLDGDLDSVITLFEFHLSAKTGDLGTVVFGLGFSVNDMELEYWYDPGDLPSVIITGSSGKVTYAVPLELSNMLSRTESVNVIMFGLWWSDQPIVTLDSVTVHMSTSDNHDVVLTPTNHNKLYYNGLYHDQLYLGDTLCWSVRDIDDPDEPDDPVDFSVTMVPTSSWETGGRYFYQLTLTITSLLTTSATSWEVTWQAGLGVKIEGEWNSISETFPLTGKVITRNGQWNGNIGAGQIIEITLAISVDHPMVF